MAEGIDRDTLPQATVVPRRRTRISAIWIIPVLVAVVALGIAIQRILSEGPTITIVFKAAEGIEAGKTAVKYKDVNIGLVKAVHLTSDYSKVVVTAKIAKSAAGLMVEDAKFWVVKPRIGLTGISGLGTLLSGNYIGFEAGKSDKQQRKFTGLEAPPITTAGRQFVLKATKLGSVGINAPIYYRSLQAGQVLGYNLAGDGKTVNIKIFIDAPYDQYVNPETRFWNASGIDVSVGANGLDVQMESLVALLEGGLAFDTPTFLPPAEPAAENTVFTLYGNRAIAMKQPPAITKHFVLYFNESVRGLSVGAPVTFLGLPAGEVTDVGLRYDPATMDISSRVQITFFPERLVALLPSKQAAAGKAVAQSLKERLAVIRRQVEERGLRAQLRSGSLLTGQLYVALDYFPDAPKVKLDLSQEVPEMPVVPSTVADLEAKINGIVDKLDKLPYEAIGDDLKKVLVSADQVLESANVVLKDTSTTIVGKDAPGQQELRNALQEVARAARSLRTLTDYLERHPEALIQGKTEEKP